jgi:hypothetical protein
VILRPSGRRCAPDEGPWRAAAPLPRRSHSQRDRGSVLAEQIKAETYDGATPYSIYVRGVIIDGDRGVLLTDRDDSALITEG